MTRSILKNIFYTNDMSTVPVLVHVGPSLFIMPVLPLAPFPGT